MRRFLAEGPAHCDERCSRAWLRWAITFWVVFAVASAVKVCIENRGHAVYPVFALGARHVWSDQPLCIDYGHVDLFRYSPTFALIVSPFASMPDRIGGAVWNFLTTLLMLAAMRTWVRRLAPGDWPPWREAFFLNFGLSCAFRGLWSAHNNPFLIAPLMFGLVAARQKRWWLASFLLAFPVFIKVWPVALSMLLIACFPWQLAGRFVVACAVWAALPFCFMPADVVLAQYDGWIQMILDTGATRWDGYRDAWTIVATTIGPLPRGGYAILQLSAALLVLALALRLRLRKAPLDELITAVFCAWIGWQLTFGPGTERLTSMIVAAPIAFAMLRSYRANRHLVMITVSYVLLLLMSMGSIEREVANVFPWAPILLPVGALLLLVWTFLEYWPDRTASTTGDDHAMPTPARNGDPDDDEPQNSPAGTNAPPSIS